MAVRRAVAAALATLALLLTACASRPPERDGPDARPPANLERVPDAVPRVEPLRAGGPNKPYEAHGRNYVPLTTDAPLAETGLASWYGRKYHGKPTSSGEPYDMYAMTAAHPTMPIPSYARVRNPANGREVIVRINDRGPFASGRVIDLSYTAALKLGVLSGVAPVEVRRLTHAEIRAGLGVATAAVPPELAAAAASATLSARLPLDDAGPGNAAPALAGVWLQLGAFRDRDRALQLLQRAEQAGSGAAVAVFDEAGLLRVQAGPFATRADAQAAAERLRQQLGIAAQVIERR